MATKLVSRGITIARGYPNSSVFAKVKKLILGSAKAAYLTRKDIANVISKNNFRHAPNTLAFLRKVKADAKRSGDWYVKFEVPA